MKNLNNYISEKLNIGKDFKIPYYVDDLTNQDMVLYSDVDDELDIDWNDFKDELDQIGDKYDRTVGGYFFCAKPLSKYNGQTLLEHITCLEFIDDVISEICTGKDAGYVIKLVHGHIEVSAINSGSRSTYYIYAVEPKMYDRLLAWYEGDDSIESLDFIFEKGTIIPIEL